MQALFRICLYVCSVGFTMTIHAGQQQRRSISPNEIDDLVNQYRLDENVKPHQYNLHLQPFPEDLTYNAHLSINVTLLTSTDILIIHVGPTLKIQRCVITPVSAWPLETYSDGYKYDQNGKQISINNDNIRVERNITHDLLILHLDKVYDSSITMILEFHFSGQINDKTSQGFFRTTYLIDSTSNLTKFYMATLFEPNLARTVFPCFDAPSMKAKFQLNLVRPKSMISLSNVDSTTTSEYGNSNENLELESYSVSQPMNPSSFGFFIGEYDNITTYMVQNLSQSNSNKFIEHSQFKVRVWVRPDFLPALKNTLEKILKTVVALETFFMLKYPIPVINIIALPNFQASRPSSGQGIIMIKESDFSGRGFRHIVYELVYQWLGCITTVSWWDGVPIVDGYIRYVTSYIYGQMEDSSTGLNNNSPMTTLYSIYYELSKRYPHSKTTVIKQDSYVAKVELVFRMLNYVLGRELLQRSFQRILREKQFASFDVDEIWHCIQQEVSEVKILQNMPSTRDIALSWITTDRLPVVTVNRNYENNSATISQRVYLRERPHSMPDQDRFLWWIPLVIIKTGQLDFVNIIPVTWMSQRMVTIDSVGSSEDFIIVNPEEIGPYPVNYDVTNWSLLSQYLCGVNRTKIPVVTRAKLLHDAWNLAYAGDLSFATALNMTLFLKNEREHLAWDPVFTLIDHIGKHIDKVAVHEKFLIYVRLLLTPLYEELSEQDQSANGKSSQKDHLRNSIKVFLCQAGYKPCVHEAKENFRKWMESRDPDEGNSVSNQYICPVFKWGSMEEWTFGLNRVLNFPANRKKNERTYLLKSLAGCPYDSPKIVKLFQMAFLERKLSENDIYLILTMITSNTNGYTTLFNFLQEYWSPVRRHFSTNVSLWNAIITSATSFFKTQQGYEMVHRFYQEKKSHLGNADFIVEKAMNKILEEAKWSTENLPVIESWLDDFLKKNEMYAVV